MVVGGGDRWLEQYNIPTKPMRFAEIHRRMEENIGNFYKLQEPSNSQPQQGVEIRFVCSVLRG